jgi:hypothetical protein
MINERCMQAIGAAPFGLSPVNMFRRFVQTPDHLMIHTEEGSDLRIVRIGAEHGPANLTFMFGDSVARWERDVLVVDTQHFSPGVLLRGGVAGRLPVGGGSRLVERFERVSADELVYSFQLEDLTLYSAPVKGEMSFIRSEEELFESTCHEGNYGLPNILSGARVTEARAAVKPKKR